MHKRQVLTGFAALTGAALALSRHARAATAAAAQRGPALLTVTGAIGHTNRGPLDPALDQLMVKQKIAFQKAMAFDFGALNALPSVQITPTLEYDARPHRLRGPLLVEVLKAAGVATGAAGATVLLRALDGYAVKPTLAEVTRLRVVLATHLDDEPMPLGGLGPLWAVIDADRVPELAAKPLKDRFALCPWGTYHIDVSAA